MEPINKKQRNSAIWKVIGLFVLSLVLALLPFFKTLTQPRSEKEILNQDLQSVNEQMEFQQSHLNPQIIEINELLEKLGDPTNQNPDVINSKIGSLISKMEKNIDDQKSAEAWQIEMYQEIAGTYNKYHREKKEFLKKNEDLEVLVADIDDCNNELQKCLTGGNSTVELIECRSNLTNLKNQNSSIINQYDRMKDMVNTSYGRGTVPNLRL